VDFTESPKRIAVIGNGGGGKTTLSRVLAGRLEIPLIHVDGIQFLPGLKVRDRDETSKMLNDLADEKKWLIDGFGSIEVMRRRFALADQIIFVDFPLWRHYWWCTKRQITSLWRTRAELPLGCDEATLRYTLSLYKTLWRVHTQIRPILLTMFSEPEIAKKVLRIHTIADWRELAESSLFFKLQ
jgi:adenylate kinase family enzyme